jgi:hypothetical protein
MNTDEWCFIDGGYFLYRNGGHYCVAFQRVTDFSGEYLIMRNGVPLGACWPLRAAQDFAEQHASQTC